MKSTCVRTKCNHTVSIPSWSTFIYLSLNKSCGLVGEELKILVASTDGRDFCACLNMPGILQSLGRGFSSKAHSSVEGEKRCWKHDANCRDPYLNRSSNHSTTAANPSTSHDSFS